MGTRHTKRKKKEAVDRVRFKVDEIKWGRGGLKDLYHNVWMFIKELVRSSPAAQPLHMNLNPKFEQRRFLNSRTI